MDITPIASVSTNSLIAAVSGTRPLKRAFAPDSVDVADESDDVRISPVARDAARTGQAPQEEGASRPGTAYGLPISQLVREGQRYRFGAEESEDNAVVTGGHDAESTRENALAPNEETEEQSEETRLGFRVEGEEDAEGSEEGADLSRPTGRDGEPLTDDEVQLVQELKQRDMEVRRHEMAHIAASGGHARGGAHFEYQVGPDGKRYAVGGDVSIDISAGNTPEETVRKMQAVQRAALAPAQPSSQDRSVAAAAARKEMQARAELLEAAVRERQEAERSSQAAPESAGPGAEAPDIGQGEMEPVEGIAPTGNDEAPGLVAPAGEASALVPNGENEESIAVIPSEGEEGGMLAKLNEAIRPEEKDESSPASVGSVIASAGQMMARLSAMQAYGTVA